MTAKVYHADLWGLREVRQQDPRGDSQLTGGKYHWLYENDTTTTEWTSVQAQSPFYLFVPQETELLEEYEQGARVTDAMPVNSVGMVTARDKLTIHWSEQDTWNAVRDFCALPPEAAREKYSLGRDVRDWKVSFAQADLKRSGPRKEAITPVVYRPFDRRYTYYTGQTRGFICMPRPEVMHHMLAGRNIAIVFMRQVALQEQYSHFYVTRHLIDNRAFYSNKGIMSLAPLYVYPKTEEDELFKSVKATDASDGRRANLAPEFVRHLSQRVKLTFVPDGKGDLKHSFGPEDVFHYMYAVFHSPTYRSRYAAFLKIDFARLPLTGKRPLFRDLCALGEELVGLHLMEKQGPRMTQYPVAGENRVEKVQYSEPSPPPLSAERGGCVWINKRQYFDNVPGEVWQFHVGGYQVCQKWLKDRKGRQLTYDDLTHYQDIVSALAETIRLMAEIDQRIERHGGWPIG